MDVMSIQAYRASVGSRSIVQVLTFERHSLRWGVVMHTNINFTATLEQQTALG